MKRRYFLVLPAAGLMAAMFWLGFSQNALAADAPAKAKVLHFTRSQGFVHSPARMQDDGTTVSGVALKAYLADKNIELVETQDGRVFDGDLGGYDAFIFYTSGNLLADSKIDNDRIHKISPEGFQKLRDAIQGGKGLVGIHSATDTHCGLKDEDGKDLYTQLMGARFCGHGPMQNATVTATQPIELPWLKEKDGGKSTDFEEWYAMHLFNTDMHVVLVQETEGMNGDCYKRAPFPSSWVRMEGKGRVAYSAYGHDNKFWQEAENVRKVGEFVEWVVGRFDLDTTPNFEKVTPEGERR